MKISFSFIQRLKIKKVTQIFTPDELEADLDYSGSYAYPPEEWKLVNPDESPEVQKLVSETNERHRERAVFDLINELKNKKS